MKYFDEISKRIKIKIEFRGERIRFLEISLYLDRRESKIRYISLSR